MPAKPRLPALVLHKPSGQSVVSLRSPDGKRKLVYLGRHGSPESMARYREVVAQFVGGNVPDTATAKAPPASEWPTVAGLVAKFLLFAQQHYRDETGQPSREVENYATACAPFLAILRDRHVDSLTCADLAAVRTYWVEAEFGHKRDKETKQPIPGTGKRHSRRYVNDTLARCKLVLRWGAENNLVPGPVWGSLSAFRSLGIGRGGARESVPVEAVPRPLVDAVLPHLPPLIRSAVELLWWSGMRAGELCKLRMRDVERAGDVWLYRPHAHKGTWRGQQRTVRFGPRCQELLRPLLTADAGAFVFSPDRAMRERRAAWRAARTSKVTPSQRQREAKNARKASPYGDQFEVAALRRAVHRACDEAGVPRWGLHRLRHAAGTRLAIEADDEAARVQLGHADGRMVRRYSRAADAVKGRQVASQHA